MMFSATPKGFQRWQFSDDSACTWWDFTWKYFAIDFQDGLVVKKYADLPCN